ncbi:MAG: TIGR00269 family protein [Candidatus Altiarchaeota archaeon]|nr:TIGR00269 family protein [Candidatus Altiarchaeota archaeon]
MNCSLCSRRSVVELNYYGQRLCRKHFNGLFERRVRKTIRTSRMFHSTDRIVVGLSGGKDSAVMLHILNDLFGKNPRMELIPVTIDEGIEAVKGRLKQTKALCKMIGLEQRVYSLKDAVGFTVDEAMGRMKDGAGACTYCGVLRRRVLNDVARGLSADKVAIGHNLDDEIQSAFMNFVRGDLDRIARLGPIVGVMRNERLVSRVKPLRDVLESEVLLYAKLNDIPFSSFKCPYAGDSFRTTVKRILNELDVRHPGSKFQMLQSTDQLVSLMKERVLAKGDTIRSCLVCGEPTSQEKCKTCIILEKVRV